MPYFVVPGGLEPPLAEPKSVVLPLHHGTIASAKVVLFYIPSKFFTNFFHSLFPSSLFFFPFFSFQKPYNHLIFNYLQGCLFSFFARFVFFKKYSFSFHFSRSSLSSGGVLLLSATQKSLQYHSFSAVKWATFHLNNNSFEPQKC